MSNSTQETPHSKSNTIHMCLDILEKTNDGNDLGPDDLSFIQSCVNAFQSVDSGEYPKALEALTQLYTEVKAGTYKPAWFCDVEYMTQDHEGYIYFKGQHVEHFTNYAYPSYEKMKLDCQNLQHACLVFEKQGRDINSWAIIFYICEREKIKNISQFKALGGMAESFAQPRKKEKGCKDRFVKTTENLRTFYIELMQVETYHKPHIAVYEYDFINQTVEHLSCPSGKWTPQTLKQHLGFTKTSWEKYF